MYACVCLIWACNRGDAKGAPHSGEKRDRALHESGMAQGARAIGHSISLLPLAVLLSTGPVLALCICSLAQIANELTAALG